MLKHYRARFYLAKDIEGAKNFEEAKEYLSDNLSTYYDGLAKDKVVRIYFNLLERSKGFVEIECKEYLSREERNDLYNFIVDEAFEGIGEGFSGQDFAEFKEDGEFCYNHISALRDVYHYKDYYKDIEIDIDENDIVC